jgi:hypothetical protein
MGRKMPYTSELIATKKVIYTRYFGDVSLDDIAGATGQTQEFLNASEEPLYVLTDVTDVRSQVNRLVEIWQFAKPVVKHKRFAGWLVAGVKSPLTGFVLKMIAKFGNILYHEFDNREAGLAFVDELNLG